MVHELFLTVLIFQSIYFNFVFLLVCNVEARVFGHQSDAVCMLSPCARYWHRLYHSMQGGDKVADDSDSEGETAAGARLVGWEDG